MNSFFSIIFIFMLQQCELRVEFSSYSTLPSSLWNSIKWRVRHKRVALARLSSLLRRRRETKEEIKKNVCKSLCMKTEETQSAKNKKYQFTLKALVHRRWLIRLVLLHSTYIHVASCFWFLFIKSSYLKNASRFLSTRALSREQAQALLLSWFEGSRREWEWKIL